MGVHHDDSMQLRKYLNCTECAWKTHDGQQPDEGAVSPVSLPLLICVF